MATPSKKAVSAKSSAPARARQAKPASFSRAEARRDLREGLVVPGTEILATLYLNPDSSHPANAIINLDPVSWTAYGSKTRTRNIASTFMSVRINHIRAEWVPAASTLASGSVYMGFFRHDDMDVTPSGVMASESHISGSVFSKHTVDMSPRYLPSRDYIFRQRELGQFPMLVVLVESAGSGAPTIAGKVVIHYNFSWSSPAVEPINFEKITVPLSQANSDAVLAKGAPLEGFILEQPATEALTTAMNLAGASWSSFFGKLVKLGKAVLASLQPTGALKLVIDGVSALVAKNVAPKITASGLLAEGDDPNTEFVVDADAAQTSENTAIATYLTCDVSYPSGTSEATTQMFDLMALNSFTKVENGEVSATKTVILTDMSLKQANFTGTADTVSYSFSTLAQNVVLIPPTCCLVGHLDSQVYTALLGKSPSSKMDTIIIYLPYLDGVIRQFKGANKFDNYGCTLMSRAVFSTGGESDYLYTAYSLDPSSLNLSETYKIGGVTTVMRPFVACMTSIHTNMTLINGAIFPKFTFVTASSSSFSTTGTSAMLWKEKDGTAFTTYKANYPNFGTDTTNSVPSSDVCAVRNGYRPAILWALQSEEAKANLRDVLLDSGVPASFFVSA